jgi:hypothetical protein
MSGIAALLLELGHQVSGSDKASTVETDRLQRLGLRFHESHHADDASDADLIVFSSAITINNPILLSARDFGKPTMRRAGACRHHENKARDPHRGNAWKNDYLCDDSARLREASLHPSHYVGAEIPILGSNAHWDPLGEYFVRKAVTKAMDRCAAFTPSTPSF